MQMMQPRAGLVFKTRTLPAKGSAEAPKKVFVNVVMHELVQRPLDAAMREVSEQHLDTLGIANLRVPLDVGEARACPDNSGGDALAIDVIFNPALVERALQDSPGPTVMGQVACVGACALNLRARWHLVSFARGRKHALTGPRTHLRAPAQTLAAAQPVLPVPVGSSGAQERRGRAQGGAQRPGMQAAKGPPSCLRCLSCHGCGCQHRAVRA